MSSARTPPPRLALRPRTIYLLNQATQAVRSRLDQALRPIGMTGIQYTVLAMVNARTGVSSADLARRFFVTPQTMNEIVMGLERRGLLSRAETPGNRRVLTVSLTDEGRAVLGECDRIADGIEAQAFGWLSERDFAELRRLSRVLLRGPKEG